MAQAQLPEFISFEDLKSGAHIKMLRQLIRKYEEGKIGSRDFERAQEACHAFAQTPGFLFGKSKAQSLMPASGSGVSGHKIEHNCMLFVNDTDADKRYAHVKQKHVRPVGIHFELVSNFDGTGSIKFFVRPFPVLIAAQHVKEKLLLSSGKVSDFIDNQTILASCMALLEVRVLETEPNLPELGGMKPFFIPHTSGLLLGHAVPLGQDNILSKGIAIARDREFIQQPPVQQKPTLPNLLGLPTQKQATSQAGKIPDFLSSSSSMTGRTPTFQPAFGPKTVTTRDVDVSPLWQPQYDMEVRTYIDARESMGGQKETYGRLWAHINKDDAFYNALLVMMNMFTVGEDFDRQRLYTGVPAASVKGALGEIQKVMTSTYWRNAGLRSLKTIARRLAPREPT